MSSFLSSFLSSFFFVPAGEHKKTTHAHVRESQAKGKGTGSGWLGARQVLDEVMLCRKEGKINL